MSSTINVPADFICPITSSVMENPVMDREGNSYEESAIKQWLDQGNTTSPITRNTLAKADLVVNRALKNAIEQFLRENQGKELSVTNRRPQVKTQDPGKQRQTAGGNVARQNQPQHHQQPPDVRLVHDDDGRYLLSIQPPAGPTGMTTDPTNDRLPVDIVCVIDISGSMQTGATVQNEKNEVESHGLTVFDVVEHATKTVSKLLGPNDRFALVTFNQVAQTVLSFTTMDEAGKKSVEEKLAAINASGRTNLWGGLQTAMDLIKDGAAVTGSQQRTTSVMLLTDGRPNVEPPRGHMPTLKQYLSKLSPTIAPFTINTFGFGFDLDSALLNDVAAETGGMYVFIPDSGLVGTVFVNTVANLLSTMASNVHVSIEGPAPITKAMQLAPTQFGGQGCLGSLQYGQSRDTFFTLSKDRKQPQRDGQQDKVFAKVDMVLNNEKVSLTVESQPATALEAPKLRMHGARSQFCSVITTSSPETAKQRTLPQLKTSLENVQATNGCDSALVVALLKDTQGEVSLAYSKDTLYNKWGKHYLPSLVRANILQQCNNFKDHSVQLYGGALFSAVRDAGESTFLALPPPVAKPRPQSGNGLNGGRRNSLLTSARVPARAAAQPAAPVNMNNYYNCGGGCVSADSLVALRNGESRKACQVKRGDVLSNGSTVDCRVEIATQPDLVLVEFAGGLVISPYHPIRHSGSSKWVFPIDSEETGKSSYPVAGRPTIYSFLLETKGVSGGPSLQWLSVNGVDVVAMGHGLKDEENIVSHSYFGTEAIRSDLEARPGHAEEGVVQVAAWTRDPITLKVSGLV